MLGHCLLCSIVCNFSFSIISLEKRELVDLFLLSSWCHVANIVHCFFLTVPWVVGMQCEFMPFPSHTHTHVILQLLVVVVVVVVAVVFRESTLLFSAIFPPSFFCLKLLYTFMIKFN